MKRTRCLRHGRARPCKFCVAYRASRAGSASSPKKTRANRKKAKAAAMARWHPDLA